MAIDATLMEESKQAAHDYVDVLDSIDGVRTEVKKGELGCAIVDVYMEVSAWGEVEDVTEDHGKSMTEVAYTTGGVHTFHVVF